MALTHSPSTVTDGLVLCLDATNPRSYPGTGTTWFDLSGNLNHGTLTNMSVPACHVRTYGGRAMEFDGNNDYVNIPHNSVLSNFNGGFSVCAWIRSFSNSSPVYSFVSKGGLTSPENDFSLFYYNNKLQWSCDSIYADQGWTGLSYPFDWSFVCGTYLKNTKLHKLFYNGFEVYSYTGTGSAVNQGVSITIGAEIENGSVNFYTKAQLDDIRIYNRALSPQEIKYNFQATRGRFNI